MFISSELGFRHPDSAHDFNQWHIWRRTFEGGEDYLDYFLKKWSNRETDAEFLARKEITPIPTFAKAAILDIRNSIFQRLSDIARIGGSLGYQKAMLGEDGGVDRRGSSMNSFIGIDVLTELLIMGRVGIYVDAPSVIPTTLAEDARNPFLYIYRVEDIISWTLEKEENPGIFKAVLLRDHVLNFDSSFGVDLPKGRATRFRLVWKDDVTGKVHYKLLDKDKNVIFLPDSLPDGSVMLDIEIVPFIMPSIGDSLLKDVASYQRALLNMTSADVAWAVHSNIPFLTIQQDLRTVGSHLKKPSGNTAEPGDQLAANNEEVVGAGKGRYYDKDLDRPDFIAPPTDPLLASMRLQEKMEDDIRKLVNLAVANKVGSRTESAEAKKLSSQGLEAGLSFIGLVLQQAEQAIAKLWASYENVNNPEVAIVSYPKRYILKSDEERLKEASDLFDLADRIPGKTMKKFLYSMVAHVLLSGRQSAEEIEQAVMEIAQAGYTSSDLDFIIRAHEAGMVGSELASEALGFRKGEVEKAKADRVERAVAILAAQTSPNGGVQNPASRGVPSLDADPQSGKAEQEAGRERKAVQEDTQP